MGQWHIDEIANSLEQKGFRFIERQPGDSYRISASLVFARSLDNLAILNFDGLDDMVTLPTEKTCGCRVRDTDISLSLRKKRNQEWHSDLEAIIEMINISV